MSKTLRPTDSVSQPAPLTKAERVEHVAALMREGKWVTGTTGRELAKAWGISVSSMYDVGAEASRLARQAYMNRDAGALYIDGMCREIAEDKSEATADRIKALVLLKDVTGAAAPTKTEVTVRTEETPEEAREKLRALMPELAKVTG